MTVRARWLALLLAAAALAAGAPARAQEAADAPPPRRAAKAPARPFPALAQPKAAGPVAVKPVKLHARAAGLGTVLSVTARRAYLDAGAKDGLAPGRELRLERKGRPAGRCTVEAVSDRGATCAGQDLRAGDTFALAAPPPAAAVSRTQAAPPPPLAPAEVSRRRAALEAAPVARVEYVAPPRLETARGPQRVEVSFLHLSSFSSGGPGLSQDRLEARVYGAEVGAGLRLFLDASGVYRATASSPSERFRPGDAAYLEVRELQLTTREPDRAYALSVGRILPWAAPGSTVFDGAQLGWRGRLGELGVFGGAVPDAVTTGLGTSRATAGAYGALEHATDAVLVRAEGRVAMVRSPELGTRLETEALGHGWLWRALDLSGQARLGFGGDRNAPAALDAARVDLSGRLAEPLWLTASFRYVGLFTPDAASPALFPGPARHADLTASWDASRHLTLRAIAGYARDLSSGLDRKYAGPELALPHLFGRYGSASAGWLEERGWAGGRSVWVQGEGDALLGARLLLRASLYMDARPPPLSDTTTVGFVASATRDLAAWLRLRLSAMGRLGVATSATDTLGGISVLAGLDGLY
ncbi:hypothetical protein [Anaeromyxobacter diazotrophicus]|uniref:Uncharacterized protein n=1 Tax=Anaeromyxobacter diazotrophicus TaxID=2590199 RepID=A0A7I9VR28_9BACT|nr:hypothetical protein [Anaeromyxobacter diazotrophicus]GEJ58570.1 hypothetical protein AMYX_33110 [Anaeromyxobacter diazotrophicus]